MSSIYFYYMFRFSKQFISVICVSVSLVSPTFAATSFPDVTSSNPGYTPITFVNEREIMTGSEDGKFHPELSLTRCELAKITFILGRFLPLTGNHVQEFSDLPTDNYWCEPIVHALKYHNVINGYSDGTFRPNQKVSQIEALKMLFNAMQLSLPPATTKQYDDVNVNDWWAPYIQYAQGHEITLHRFGPKYGIQNEMSRGETAHIIWRLSTLLGR